MAEQPKTKKLKMINDDFVVTWPHPLCSKTFQPVCQYQPLPPWAEYDTSPTESPSDFESIVSDGQAKFKRVLEEPVIAAVIQLTEATLYELECSFTAVNDDKDNIKTFLDKPYNSNNSKNSKWHITNQNIPIWNKQVIFLKLQWMNFQKSMTNTELSICLDLEKLTLF